MENIIGGDLKVTRGWKTIPFDPTPNIIPPYPQHLNKFTPTRLKILIWGNSILSQHANSVKEFDDDLSQLLVDMHHTMVSKNGVGLAAPQVGILQRVITIQVEKDKKFFLINPEILERNDEPFMINEGCLSTPGYFEKRSRPNKITIGYQDIFKNEKVSVFEGLYAFVIQHELDHLEGKVFVDGLSQLKTEIIKRKINKNKQ